MKNSFETFILAYQAAPQPIKDIIDSEEIGTFIDSMLAEEKLLANQKQTFLVIVSNRLLSIISDAEVLASLQALPLEKVLAEKTAALIHAFVQSKIDAVVEKTATPAETTEVLPPTTEQNAPAVVSHIRTMAQDMHRSKEQEAHVYSSTQDSILKHTPK
jgi:Flp pilus assembly CpaE family ATPase